MRVWRGGLGRMVNRRDGLLLDRTGLARRRVGGGQSRRELLRRLVTISWFFGERRRDDAVYPWKQIFPQRRGTRRILGEALHEPFLSGEGRFPGEHLEQHATE